MRRLDTLDRLHPFSFFYGSIGSLSGQLLSLTLHSTEALLTSESDYFFSGVKRFF